MKMERTIEQVLLPFSNDRRYRRKSPPSLLFTFASYQTDDVRKRKRNEEEQIEADALSRFCILDLLSFGRKLIKELT